MRNTIAKSLRRLAAAMRPSGPRRTYRHMKREWNRRNDPKPNLKPMFRELRKRQRIQMRNAKRAYAKENQ